MAVTVIESNTPIDTEQHFLVKAGPGAGKTYYGHENEMYNVGVSLKEVECL